MKIFTFLKRCRLVPIALLCAWQARAQTPAFPGAMGFGRNAPGARGAATREVYIVTNLNDSGTGSFRDAVSKSGRIVVFAVGGIVRLASDVVVSSNVTIAGQTAPGDGVVFFNKRITFTGADNTICRFLRIRLGATGNSGNDASGLAHGSNIIFDHLSVSWGMDEDFSINWDNKGNPPDNITIQNSIIGQGLFRENHSAGGLIQTPDGGHVSLLQNLYISNKTRNPKVKGINEFVNNVVYDWGNGNRLDQDFNYGWAGDAYIMGGSDGVSEVNVINNYFCGGPLTPPSKTTPFSRGTGTFNIYGSGNYFDNNKNGVLDGAEVPFDSVGYPGITGDAFKYTPFPYPAAHPVMTAEQAYQHVIDSVGAFYPRRDQVDGLMLDEVASKGTKGLYVYRETDLPFTNGGLGNVFGAPAPLDTDGDGMPDAWEDANGLNKNNKADAVAFSTTDPRYLNIEMYINSLVGSIPAVFVKPPTGLALTATSQEVPAGSTVKLTWVDNSDNETNFVVERSANGTTFTDIAHTDANALTYTDNTGLVPNTTYYYRVKAINATDASAYSAIVSIATPPIPSAPAVTANPTPTNGFQYAALTSGKLALKWTGSTNTVTYSVYLGTDPANLTKQADVAYVAAPTYTTGVLLDNTTYYWRVDAVNAKGAATGVVWSFRTPPIIPQGLVGYYAFDEALDAGTSQVTDSTSYANTGVIGLDADTKGVRTTGKLKNGLDFATADPSIYVVRIPNQDQLYLDKSSFSISFWMKAPAAMLPQDATSAYLLCKGSITRNAATGATGKRIDIELKSKQMRFAVDDDNDAGGGGKDELQVDGTTFFTNTWVHVVVVRDVTNKKLLLYKNGVLFGSLAITKSNSGIGEASALVLGNIGELEFLATTNKPAPYKGMLDEVRIYNYVLSAPEITALASVKNAQTINFAAIEGKKVGDADFDALATASSGLPVTLTSSDTTVASIKNGKIHVAAAGTATIIAKQAGNADYSAAAAVSQPITVTKYDQTITFGPLPVKTIGDTAFIAGATASSGLSVTLSSSDTSVAIITGNGRIFARHPGTAIITASQAGNAKFSKADSVTQQLTVNKKSQTITFGPISNKILGSGSFLLTAKSSSGLPITYAISDTTVATTAIGRIFLKSAGTTFITASQPGNDLVDSAVSVTQKLIVIGMPQTITFNPLPAKTIGDPDFTVSATASSGLPVTTFVSSNNNIATVVNGVVHITGAGTVSIKAEQEGDAHYAFTSFTQTLVVRGLNIQVQALDGDNGQVSNNAIRPYLKLVNNDSVAVAYNQLTARYWFTAENFSGINTFIDYAQMGGNNIVMKYVPLTQPRNGALGYIEYSFTTSATLAANGNSGPIQSRFANKDWANLLETDDYSYAGNPGNYTANQHITLYRNGQLIYGVEPAAIPAVTNVNVTYQSQSAGNNSISNYIAVNNTGNTPLNYADLKVRYWFTKDGTAGLNYFIDYAKLGNSAVSGQFVTLSPALLNADTYFELSFSSSAGTLSPLSSSGNVQYRISKTDWSAFNSTNDHSYAARTSTMQENTYIGVYYQGQLIYGTEPASLSFGSGTTSMAAFAPGVPLSSDITPQKVVLYPNPLTSQQFSIKLTSDLLNKDIDLKIRDSYGKVIQSRSFHGNDGSLSVQLNGNYMPGVYFVQLNDSAMIPLLINH